MVEALCRSGYAEGTADGLYRLRPAPSWGGSRGPRGPRKELPGMLSDAVTELYGRTGARAYLAEWADDDRIDVVDARGHDRLARIPDLPARVPPSMAHALAVSKVLVAHSPGRRARLDPRQWRAYTPATITSPDAFDLELARVRRDGVALDREEFAVGFGCVCAPIADPNGRVSAAIAITMPSRRLAAETDRFVAAVTDVARTAHRSWY